jgi:chemotaxis protein CheC
MEIEKFNQLNQEAAAKASQALSKLIDNSVEVKLKDVGLKKIEELAPVLSISPEDVVVGVYLRVTGDVQGSSLLVFAKETALRLCDSLFKREPGTTRKLSELDQSALKEVGNIVCGNYLTVLGNKLQVKIVEHPPHFSMDMFGALLGQVVSQFSLSVDQGIAVEIEFSIGGLSLIKGYTVLFFTIEETKAILEALEG